MPTVRRSLKLAKETYQYWLEVCNTFTNSGLTENGDELVYVAQNCAEELLQYCDVTTCFGYLEQCLKVAGVHSPGAAAYWYLKDHYKNTDTPLPRTLKDHWVATHLSLLRQRAARDLLLLEKEHVREIAGWQELYFVASEVRHISRKIEEEQSNTSEYTK